MTNLDDNAAPATSTTAEPVDGRVARRQSNIDAVLDVVMQMFEEDAMFPTIEQAATRSGLSLRSLYRYFADPSELVEAAIKRGAVRSAEASRLHAIGQGPLEVRVEEFVAMRLRVREEFGHRYRATMMNSARHQRVHEELTKNRHDMRAQFELQFAPELDALAPDVRDAVLSAGDLLTQLESVDYLRRHRELSVAGTQQALVTALQSLLG